MNKKNIMTVFTPKNKDSAIIILAAVHVLVSVGFAYGAFNNTDLYAKYSKWGWLVSVIVTVLIVVLSGLLYKELEE